MPPSGPSSPSPSPSPSRSSAAAVVSALRAGGCVFAEDEAELILATARTEDEVSSMVDRRVAGLPLEQVLGWARFHGLRVVLEPGVFVPRRRTEFLVDQALAQAPDARVVVDLCCGSGALGAALAAALDGAEVHAADIDPAAVRCARRNLAAFTGRAHQGDLYDALPAALRGRVGIVTANVPYVPTGELPLLPAEARDHEPRAALDGGPDGLDLLRRVAVGAPEWLAPGGLLLSETSERQAPAAVRAFTDAGLTTRLAVSEELSAHVVIGVRPQDPPGGGEGPAQASRTSR
ncbi:putative protein N(5)-glutamine methyltransferase [Streptomyces sp. NPDC007206]|uniref:putative protein N(5)-glutamine methyltransferase n=1 Tax=Streptomyces sp. NPDC007206 TaxID=3154317 RepID=UPI0033FC8710